MFSVGDCVVYGNSGVCKIEAIGPLNFSGTSKDKLYYTLMLLYKNESKIFTPVDNNKIITRPVISYNEAMELIDDIENIELLWIADERRRETEYCEAFKKCDCKELIRIIKTTYMRRQSRLADGKKITVNDEKYFTMAEESLYGELAVALDIDRDEVKPFIMNRVGDVKNYGSGA